MPQSGYNTNTPDGFGLYGVLYTAFNTSTGVGTKVGVTRGGLTFNPNHTIRNPEYDGKLANIKGIDRITFRNPTISGTMIELTAANLMMIEPGGATPVTLKDSGTFLASGDYLTNVAIAFERPDGSVFGYNLPDALVTTYDVAGQNSEGETEVAITIEGRLEHGATPDEGSPPFEAFEIAA
ncbi:hypothetical protein LCGC14_1476360 [marine sediment metagenome]|uniref:Uncharacterized protein n=1 Tax=marine sediment metagenome TaxID=412755 RepID=A0A0F9JAW1_9ZZZZ